MEFQEDLGHHELWHGDYVLPFPASAHRTSPSHGTALRQIGTDRKALSRGHFVGSECERPLVAGTNSYGSGAPVSNVANSGTIRASSGVRSSDNRGCVSARGFSCRVPSARSAPRWTGPAASDLVGDEASGDRAPNLTLVVPAFNEAERLSNKAERLNHAIETGVLDQRSTELIVVDDGSTDGTGRLAKELLASSFDRLHVLRLDVNAGKGAAVRAGVAAAGAPVVAFMDADMSVDPHQIPRLVNAIGQAEVAIGSRSLRESTVENAPSRRKYMGRAFNGLVNAITRISIRDTQCGFKAFQTPVARMLFHFMEIDGFAFDVELLYLAHRLGLGIVEVPVNWRDCGGSTVRLSDPVAMILGVLRMCVAANLPEVPGIGNCLDPLTREPSVDGVPAGVFEAVGSNVPILRMGMDRLLILFP